MKRIVIMLVVVLVAVVTFKGCSKMMKYQEHWFDYTEQVDLKLARYDKGENWVRLGIEDIRWDRFAGTSEVGWCGEASLQMALAYNGVYISQGKINRLGKSRHLDLYSDEIGPTIRRLGLSYEPYENKEVQSAQDYLTWIEEKIREGKPVFSGMKNYPYGNPEWNLDHFVLMVGYENEHMIYNANTPGKGQITVSYEGLDTQEKGYRLNNRYNTYFGLAIQGFENETRAIIPLLHILGESKDEITLGITLEGLEIGKRYQLEAIPFNEDFTDLQKEKTEVIQVFTPTQAQVHFMHEKIDRQAAYYYQVGVVPEGNTEDK